jgi:hypothetical protein
MTPCQRLAVSFCAMALVLSSEFSWSQEQKSNFEQYWDGIGREVQKDWQGITGRKARETCSNKLGVRIRAETAVDVAKHYGAERAIAWLTCVTDEMYPEPKR